MAAFSMMKECLYSVVCRVPLIEGAEVGQRKLIARFWFRRKRFVFLTKPSILQVDTQLAAVALRHASHLTASMKLLLATFSSLVYFGGL